jgi:hypothetical protein
MSRTAFQRAAIVAAFGVIIAFYTWTAVTNHWNIRPQPQSDYYYAMMSRAFLAGQLDLLIKPSPELLALPDPYDPDQNQRYRLHDAILFKGKYYLYYGAVPALVLFVPFRAMTGLDFPEPLAVVIFCSAALIAEFLIVRLLARRFLPGTRFWQIWMAIPALAFGNGFPFMLRRPIHYEVAIAAGQAFVFASLYLTLAGTLSDRLRRGYVLLGSLVLGLAGGARFPMFAAGLLSLTLVLHHAIQQRQQPLREHVRTALAIFAPVAICLFLVGLYNFVRYESWTEFGFKYALQGWKSARTYQFLSLAHVRPGLFYYLLCPPYVNATFPFFHDAPSLIKPPPPDYYLESTVGLLPSVPFVGILLLSPFILWRLRRSHPLLVLITLAFLAIGGILLGLYVFWAAVQRYQVDFAAFWLIPALLFWYWLLQSFVRIEWRRDLLVMTFSGTIALTVAISTAFSLVGLYDSLHQDRPATYEAIHELFTPLEHFLHR